MREHLSSVCRLALALLAGAACLELAPARADTVQDQTFTPTTINTSSQFSTSTTGTTLRRAQTLTVGVAGPLTQVDIQLTTPPTGFTAPVFTGFDILSTTNGVPNTGAAGIIGLGTLLSQTSTQAIFTTSLAVTVGEVIGIEPITSNISPSWAGQNPGSYTRGADYFAPPNSAFLTSGAVNGFTTFVTTPSIIPLPAALPLFATGLAALGLLGWRRKRKTPA